MTRTAARLAELDRISRERPLAEAELAETYRLLRLQRQCELRRDRYASDPDFRRKLIARSVSWRREARRGHECRDQWVVQFAGAEA